MTSKEEQLPSNSNPQNLPLKKVSSSLLNAKSSKTLKGDLARCKDLARIIEDLCEWLGIKTSAGRTFVHFALANALLMDRKQQDYGPGNIKAFGTFGVTVRMNDKMERLKTLYNQGRRRRAVNESITDTYRDISNYGIIALMLENNDWPNE